MIGYMIIETVTPTLKLTLLSKTLHPKLTSTLFGSDKEVFGFTLRGVSIFQQQLRVKSTKRETGLKELKS